jgi:hypothetical protein
MVMQMNAVTKGRELDVSHECGGKRNGEKNTQCKKI